MKCSGCDEKIKICKNCHKSFEVNDDIVCLHKHKYPGHIHLKCFDFFFRFDIGVQEKAIWDGEKYE